MDTLLQAMFKEAVVPVLVAESMPEGMQAQYIPKLRTVYVRNGMSESVTFHAINRELACAALDHRDGRFSRPQVLAQAFCAAYVAAQRYGVDSSGFQFDRVCELQENGARDPKELRTFLGDVRTAAYELGRRMDRGLGAKTQDIPAEEFNVQEPKQGRPEKARNQPER